jgi:hypothetical protein
VWCARPLGELLSVRVPNFGQDFIETSSNQTRIIQNVKCLHYGKGEMLIREFSKENLNAVIGGTDPLLWRPSSQATVLPLSTSRDPGAGATDPSLWRPLISSRDPRPPREATELPLSLLRNPAQVAGGVGSDDFWVPWNQ